MSECRHNDIVVSGIGITSAIGQGVKQFTEALMQGRSNFRVMERIGRQVNVSSSEKPALVSKFLGAEIQNLTIPDRIPESLLRTASFSSQVGLATLCEAWADAGLHEIDPSRIGLVVGGSNFQQRDIVLLQAKYNHNIEFLRPSYGMSFLDSDICGLCTSSFPIAGFAHTVGGASASGQVAILQAAQAVQTGQVDACIAMGVLMDISFWECQAFQSLGAMGSANYANEPARACRPFDQDHDGFIFGESCGVVVIENAKSANIREKKPYAKLLGWATAMDGNRNPNPSFTGETRALKAALKHANIDASCLDYINPHGTGSVIGDETELNAIRECGLNHAFINTTKSIVGHGLTAAGAVEVIATLIQMKEKRLHPSINLDNPIDDNFNWVKQYPVEHQIKNSLNISLGFGGINTALCLQSCI